MACLGSLFSFLCLFVPRCLALEFLVFPLGFDLLLMLGHTGLDFGRGIGARARSFFFFLSRHMYLMEWLPRRRLIFFVSEITQLGACYL